MLLFDGHLVELSMNTIEWNRNFCRPLKEIHRREGHLLPLGRELLKQMMQLGIVLDVTHLTDEAFWEALEIYDGPVWASHNNCPTLVPHQRQFSDEQIKALIQRDALIGMAFDAWMMHTNWARGVTTPEETGVNIVRIVDHIDHICQPAENVRHVGIGSDLDGGYSREQAPLDMDSLVGFTIGNDMSSRDIEGDNPLYSPQAKVYDQCCRLGPWITLTEAMPTGDQIAMISVSNLFCFYETWPQKIAE